MSDGKSLEEKAGQLRNAGKGYEAAKAYQQAKQAYLQADDLTRAAGMQHMIGVSYKIENDLEQAMPAYEIATADYEKAGNKLGPGRVERDIGIMLEYHDRLDEAEQHLQKSKELLEQLPDDQQSAQSAQESTSRDAELGITLAKIGLLYTRQKKFDQAEGPLQQGLRLIRAVGHPFYEMTTLLHLGSLYFEIGLAEHMLTHLQAALGILDEYGLKQGQSRRLAQIHGLLAHGYAQLGNHVMAEHFARQSLDFINSLSVSAQRPLRNDIRAGELEALLKEGSNP